VLVSGRSQNAHPRRYEPQGLDLSMKYHHIGIPTHSPKDGETYLKDYDIHCTDHESNPYGIQWMRYGDNCNLPKLVKEETHIAFEVDDLARVSQLAKYSFDKHPEFNELQLIGTVP